jgi:hypothetical protein
MAHSEDMTKADRLIALDMLWHMAEIKWLKAVEMWRHIQWTRLAVRKDVVAFLGDRNLQHPLGVPYEYAMMNSIANGDHI